jgi:hypothetical protein
VPTRRGRRTTGALLECVIGCVVAAPGKIERPAQDRSKTDRRDAERVLRLLMIDGLHPVWLRPRGCEQDLTSAGFFHKEDISPDPPLSIYRGGVEGDDAIAKRIQQFVYVREEPVRFG